MNRYRDVAYIEHSELTRPTLRVARITDYFALLKPRVMSLVVFTAFVGMVTAPVVLNPVAALFAIAAIAIGGGASGALNMWYDADIDCIMSRTRNRPIPTGRVRRNEALTVGLVLSVFSVGLLGLVANWAAAALLAFTIFFYAVVYSMWLKRSTPQNIVIGGAAGAFPPMIGWVAATGHVSLDALALFLIVFLWTPPHFWALALYKKGDYEAAGIPMLPNVAGEKATKAQILFYAVILVLASFLPILTGLTKGTFYALAASGLGAVFVALAVRLWRTHGVEMKRRARELFTFSLLYLFVLYLALLADVALGRLLFGAA